MTKNDRSGEGCEVEGQRRRRRRRSSGHHVRRHSPHRGSLGHEEYWRNSQKR